MLFKFSTLLKKMQPYTEYHQSLKMVPTFFIFLLRPPFGTGCLFLKKKLSRAGGWFVH